MDYVLAQVNIGRLREPLDSPQLAGFVAALDPVNAAADAAPRFLWRLQTEDGNATAVRAFDWDQAGSAGVIMNMSVWASPEALAAFVYSDAHGPTQQAFTMQLLFPPPGAADTTPRPGHADWTCPV